MKWYALPSVIELNRGSVVCILCDWEMDKEVDTYLRVYYPFEYTKRSLEIQFISYYAALSMHLCMFSPFHYKQKVARCGI